MSHRKSAAQKVVEGRGIKIGTHRLDAMLESEPKCQTGLLPPPAQLKGDAKRIYVFYAEQLGLSELDKRPDTHALALASTALARVWACDKRLRHGGMVVKVPILGKDRKVLGHRETKSKWWSIRIEAAKEFDRFAGKFGLCGPSSRAALSVDTAPRRLEDDQELMSLLLKPRPKKDPPPLPQ